MLRISLLPSALVLAVFGLAWGIAKGAPAQVLPLGPEFQVNTYTTGSQTGPAITIGSDGSFTVVWCCGESSSGEAVVARRFDAQGVPLGGEVVLDQHQHGWDPDLAADAFGNFVLAWGHGRDGCPGCFGDYVKGRRITSDAAPLGEQFVVSPPPGGIYTGDGAVAVQPAGNFVVAWNDYDPYACEFLVSAQRFTSDGEPEGGPIRIAGGTDLPYEPGIAAESDGGFLVIWNQWDAVTESAVVSGQRYGADGAPVGDRLEVGEPAPGLYDNDLAVRPDASYVAGWTVIRDWPIADVMARRLSTSGQPLGDAFVVESYSGGSLQFDVGVAPAPDGSFVVAWSSTGSHGSDSSVFSVQARRFDSDGTPLGTQFQVNTYTPSDQFLTRGAVQPNGDLVVVWASYGSPGSDTSSSSIQARRFRPPFFMDGFERGDTSRWSQAMP